MVRDRIFINSVVEEHNLIMAEVTKIMNYSLQKMNEFYQSMANGKAGDGSQYIPQTFAGTHSLVLNPSQNLIEFKINGCDNAIKLDFKFIFDRNGLDEEIEKFCSIAIKEIETKRQQGIGSIGTPFGNTWGGVININPALYNYGTTTGFVTLQGSTMTGTLSGSSTIGMGNSTYAVGQTSYAIGQTTYASGISSYAGTSGAGFISVSNLGASSYGTNSIMVTGTLTLNTIGSSATVNNPMMFMGT